MAPPPGYRPTAAGVLVREAAADALARVDGVVFDVDGVLMDTHRSYPRVIADTTQFFFTRVLGGWGGRLITPEETALFKQAGGFNSDWLLTQTAVLFFLAKAAALGMLPPAPGSNAAPGGRNDGPGGRNAAPRGRTSGAGRTRPGVPLDLDALRAAPPSLEGYTAEVGRRGGGLDAARAVALEPLDQPARALALAHWDRVLIERLCCEHYGGDDGCEAMFGFRPAYRRGPGYYRDERPLLNPAGLAGPIRRLGLYTGRFRGEVGPALEACGLAGRIPPEAMALGDGPHKKPDPGGLFRVGAALGIRRGLFVGDNVDDLRTVQNYASARGPDDPVFLFAGILGGAPGARALDLFVEGRADAIAPDVNALLDLVRDRPAVDE